MLESSTGRLIVSLPIEPRRYLGSVTVVAPGLGNALKITVTEQGTARGEGLAWPQAVEAQHRLAQPHWNSGALTTVTPLRITLAPTSKPCLEPHVGNCLTHRIARYR